LTLFPWLAARAKPEPEPPDDDDADEGQAVSKEERRHYLLAFRLMRKETDRRVVELTRLLSTGDLDSREWAEAFRKELRAAHSEAWAIGRRLAGHVGAVGEDDVAAGLAAWDRQERFFTRFLADVESGRYTKKAEEGEDAALNEKAVNDRSLKYVASVKGTAHESFRVALRDEPTNWNLGLSAHCKPSKSHPYDCPSLAGQSPKPADEWPTAPGRGECPCGGNCTCFLSTVDGSHSTEGI